MDVSQRQGFYPTPQDAPEILGVEFAGHITALGPDTSVTWTIGDQVLGLASGVSQHRGSTYNSGWPTLQQTMLGRLCRIYCCTRNADPPQAAPTVLGGGREHSRGFHHRRVPAPYSQYGPELSHVKLFRLLSWLVISNTGTTYLSMRLPRA